MKIGTSLKYFNKKCDEFKEASKKNLLEEKAKDENALSKLLSKFVPTAVEIDQPHNNHQDSDAVLGETGSTSTSQTNNQVLSEDRQNKDIHWVNHNKIVNRVSANHLPNAGPICDIDNVDNSNLCLIM